MRQISLSEHSFEMPARDLLDENDAESGRLT